MVNNKFFTATIMPDKDWWQVLWPDPENVLQSVGLKPNMQVVDLCCGDGHFTQPMCRLVHPGKTWALEMDTGLLREAERACQSHSNFNSVSGDARDLPELICEPVDLVFIANTFHGVPDKAGLSQVVHQVLKADGRFAIINWHNRPREETTVLDQARGPDTELRMEPEEVRNVVEPAGFKLEKIVDVSSYHYAALFIKIPC
ncbi:hypothetical protein MNBD_GAMMA21-66 [hydrothermal vent metagenome]|uniref:Methyltransferase domain-containing protein n=1 Tax=hydrothermal vent metagenome TaxID=652676 RepID=A0A3B0ZB51_9ZZZZ